MFARYASTETQARYFNGAWYITRREMFPHTRWTADGRMVTKQGHAVLVGIRQGEGNDDHGFTCHRYNRPDTEIPPLTCPMCGSHDLTEPHWNGYTADATECRACDARMGTEAATPGTEVYEFIHRNRAA
jgi:hypothetical protein